jgi:coenzyme F420-reducing hydrogenase delta subunit
MVDNNKLIFLLNLLNQLLDNIQMNDGTINLDISRKNYEKLNESYNELLKVVKQIKDNNARDC